MYGGLATSELKPHLVAASACGGHGLTCPWPFKGCLTHMSLMVSSGTRLGPRDKASEGKCPPWEGRDGEVGWGARPRDRDTLLC